MFTILLALISAKYGSVYGILYVLTFFLDICMIDALQEKWSKSNCKDEDE